MDLMQLTAIYGMVLKAAMSWVMLGFYWELKKQDSRQKWVPLLLSISGILYLIADLPILIMPMLQESNAVLISHSFLLLVTTYLKWMAALHFSTRVKYLSVLTHPDKTKFWYLVGGLYLGVAAIIILLLNFGHQWLDAYFTEAILRGLDLATSGVVAVIFGWLFFQSIGQLQFSKFTQWTIQGWIVINVFSYVFFLASFFTQPAWLTFEISWIVSNTCNTVSAVLLAFYYGKLVGGVEEVGFQTTKVNATIQSIDKVSLFKRDQQWILMLTVTMSHGAQIELEVAKDRHLKPLMYWMVFILAKKKSVALSHRDMSILKFKMLEYWNKNSTHLIESMGLLFTGGRGMYELKPNVAFSEQDFVTSLEENDGVLQTILEFKSNWMSAGLESANTPARPFAKWDSTSWKDFFFKS